MSALPSIKNTGAGSKTSPGVVLDVTPLSGDGAVLALPREGVTFPALLRTLATSTPARAILVESSTPLDWLDSILDSGSEVWLTLRRAPGEGLRHWIDAHRDRVRVMIGFVPEATPLPELLAVLDELKEREVRLQVSIEGLIVGKTDTRAALNDLLASLKLRGFQQVTLSYLALDAKVEAWLHKTRPEEAEEILWQYREGPHFRWPGRGPVRLLPRSRRQRGYASLRTLAAEHELMVCISPVANPDFDRPRARIASPNRPRLSEVYLAGGPPIRFESLP